MEGGLDDFFAKRDKGKKKKKFTTDDASKVLETKAKERLKATTGKSTYVAPIGGEAPAALSEFRQQQEDDEWLEEKVFQPDYTGLKIQELVLEDSEEEEKPEGEETAEADGRGWNQVTSKGKGKEKEVEVEKEAVEGEGTVEESQEKVEPAVDAPETKESAPEEEKKTGGYVPPARRNIMEGKPANSEPPPKVESSGGGGAYVPPSRRAGASTMAKPKKVGGKPDIASEESFPTLGS